MWTKNWRDDLWQNLNQEWDMVIIGGGITGAGILKEAAKAGLKVLLVEQRDFAWGTSSRSSKLVHGGLRYLTSGQFRLTWASVREREQLLKDGAGLVNTLGFLMVTRNQDGKDRWKYAAGLSLYDAMALRWSHRYFHKQEFTMLAPHLSTDGLEGGYHYQDAQTDDARLVLRVLREAVANGGKAINYVSADELICEDGKAVGVKLQDTVANRSAEVRAKYIISATGAWADQMRQQVGAEKRLRPLRGSHLVFPSWRFPVAQAVAFAHPQDRRPVFVFPWEGVTLLGTTDIDHEGELNREPAISGEEVAYLMAAAEHQFPSLSLTLDDVIATFAGVRPVIDTGKDDPSKEARDHVVWEENGLLTVTGGKLTTFRVIAQDALRALNIPLPESDTTLNPVNIKLNVSRNLKQRLVGRYGAEAEALVNAAHTDELDHIPSTPTTWAELRWAARSEGVVHLDDLMLRRTRLGLLLPHGGEPLMDRIRTICQAELGWDDQKWQAEQERYLQLWKQHYSLPDRSTIPDWHSMAVKAHENSSVSYNWVLGIAAILGLWWLKSRYSSEI